MARYRTIEFRGERVRVHRGSADAQRREAARILGEQRERAREEQAIIHGKEERLRERASERSIGAEEARRIHAQTRADIQAQARLDAQRRATTTTAGGRIEVPTDRPITPLGFGESLYQRAVTPPARRIPEGAVTPPSAVAPTKPSLRERYLGAVERYEQRVVAPVVRPGTRFADVLEFRARREPETFRKIGLRAGATAVSFGTQTAGGIVGLPSFLARAPITAVETARRPREKLAEFRAGAYRVGEAVQQRPGASLGVAGAIFVGPKVLRKVTEPVKTFGARYVPPEKVFAGEVLRGEATFPLTKGPKQALAEFRRAKAPEGFKVVHATPVGKLARAKEVKAGPFAVKGLEDPGLFVTPKGRASPHFLGVSGEGAPPTFIPRLPRSPFVAEIAVREVRRQPRQVLLTPGYAGVESFLRGQAGKQRAFITKRSESAFDPLVRRTLPRGTGPTRELEAVVPVSARIKLERPAGFLGRIRGYEEFTRFEGRAIPIRQFKTLRFEAKAPVSRKEQLKTFERIRRGYSSIGRPEPYRLGIPSFPFEVSGREVSARRELPSRTFTALSSKQFSKAYESLGKPSRIPYTLVGREVISRRGLSRPERLRPSEAVPYVPYREPPYRGPPYRPIFPPGIPGVPPVIPPFLVAPPPGIPLLDADFAGGEPRRAFPVGKRKRTRGRYLPSLLGLEIARVTGRRLRREPDLTTALGIRLPVAR